MTKFSRPRSWVDHRLSDALEVEGRAYRVDLVARKGTGTQGYRVTVVFLPHGEGAEVQAELPPATTTADIHGRVRELAGNRERLEALYREARPA